jgi:hypothetical protein
VSWEEDVKTLTPDEPARLAERRNPTNLVERIAGQAVRELVPKAGLSPRAMARIAASIKARKAPDRRPERFAWGVTAVAFLLGIATAASVAYFDLAPGWLSRLLQP